MVIGSHKKKHLVVIAMKLQFFYDKKIPKMDSKAWFPPGDKSRFYRQIGDKSKVITKMAITLFWCEC